MSKFALLLLPLMLAACAAEPVATEPAKPDTPAQAAARAEIATKGQAAANARAEFPNLADVPARPARPTSPEQGEALIKEMQQDAASARGTP